MPGITFTDPNFLWFFLALPLLIIIHLVSLKFTRQKALRFANFEAIEKITGKPIFSRNIILLLFRMVVICVFILAIAGTVISFLGKSSDFDFVLAIDASSSMLADDYTPNRLEVAKDAATLFVDELNAQARIAVFSFAGTTFIKQRLTEDKRKVTESIKGITFESASGTAIGEAIMTATNILAESNKAKVIVLLTDGQSNVGVDIQKAIAYANEQNVLVYTIGVAKKEGGSFPNIDVISVLDAVTLEKIARDTGAKFFEAKNEEELKQAYTEIASSTTQKIKINISIFLLIVGFLLLFVEWFLQNTKYRSIP